jgi:hypothetical protein
LKKWKGRQKETAAKTEMKDDEDADAVWRASAEENVRVWLADFRDDDFEQWDEQESAGEGWEDDLFSYETDTDSLPDLITEPNTATSMTDISSESDISELVLEVDATAEGFQAYLKTILDCSSRDLPDLQSVSDSLDGASYRYLTPLRIIAIVEMTIVRMMKSVVIGLMY